MNDNMKIMAFGCSFTKFHWPTWADIVLRQADLAGMKTDNWGMPGAGNLFIAMQVQHAIATGVLKPGDHAFISWSSFAREDRIVDGKWLLPGNIFNQRTYPQDWVEKYADLEFYTLRDCALINATRSSLDALGIKQTVFSMSLIDRIGRAHITEKNISAKIRKLTDTFNLQMDCKSIIEVLGHPLVQLQVAWSTDFPDEVHTDYHQHPDAMLNYVKQELCKLGIPWLTSITPEVESWVNEWDHTIKTAPQPLTQIDFPLQSPKGKQWGF